MPVSCSEEQGRQEKGSCRRFAVKCFLLAQVLRLLLSYRSDVRCGRGEDWGCVVSWSQRRSRGGVWVANA